MINIKLKNIFLIILYFLIYNSIYSVSFSQISTKILFKINEQIITNIELENEKKFLIFLNPNLKKLSSNQIEIISIDSLKNRKIKELELEKFTDLNKENLGKPIINNFISNSKYDNKENLLIELKKINLNYKFFEKNFIIDNTWREFVLTRFKSQVKINIDKLKKQLQNRKNEIEELNMSEIIFEINPGITYEEKVKQIYSEINNSGFEAAASIFSISESKKYGGKIGWIKASQISEKIYSEIKEIKEISSPIKINNRYLIIKINGKRKINQKINYDEELNKLINIETDKELNKLGYIYFNKIKKRTFISEN